MKKVDIEFIRRVLAVFDGFNGPDQSQLWWRTDEDYGPVTFMAICNDLFLWGFSDCEEITQDNINVLEKAVEDVKAARKGTDNEYLGGSHAEAVFCCRVRKMRPQGACYDEQHYGHELWPLFDACGPERAPGLGNPMARPAA